MISLDIRTDPFLIRLLFISIEMMLYGICFSLNRYAKSLEMKKWKNGFTGCMVLIFAAWVWHCWVLYYSYIIKGVRA